MHLLLCFLSRNASIERANQRALVQREFGELLDLLLFFLLVRIEIRIKLCRTEQRLSVRELITRTTAINESNSLSCRK
jgi:hypothetical protein